MLKAVSLLVVFISLFSSPIVFAMTQDEAIKKCKQWAQDEEVQSQEMTAYMRSCVKSLTEEPEKKTKPTQGK